jgi:hypothetical protein
MQRLIESSRRGLSEQQDDYVYKGAAQSLSRATMALTTARDAPTAIKRYQEFATALQYVLKSFADNHPDDAAIRMFHLGSDLSDLSHKIRDELPPGRMRAV